MLPALTRARKWWGSDCKQVKWSEVAFRPQCGHWLGWCLHTWPPAAPAVVEVHCRTYNIPAKTQLSHFFARSRVKRSTGELKEEALSEEEPGIKKKRRRTIQEGGWKDRLNKSTTDAVRLITDACGGVKRRRGMEFSRTSPVWAGEGRGYKLRLE